MSITIIIIFCVSDAGKFFLDLKNGTGSAGAGDLPDGADVNMTLTPDNFVKMFKGTMNPTTAFMSGKLKIKGDLPTAMKLEKVMKQARSKL